MCCFTEHVRFPEFLVKLLFVISESQMASLQKDLNISRRSAYAEGTVKNLRIQWESYLSFCLYFGLSYLPADTNILCLYAQCLCRTFKSTHSVRNWLILHTPGPEIRQHVAYIYIDTPCAYPPSYPSIRYA